MLDYDVMDSLLVRVEAEAYAAECHGFVCGQICVTGNADPALWTEFLDVRGNDEDLIRICYEELSHLVVETLEQMHDAEFGLQLLLPDDETSMALRIEALGNWCHGFLNGFGVSEDQNQSGMSEAGSEVLEDFTEICRLGVDEEDSNDEHSLMELVEYARMGAILIFEELQPAFGQSEVLH
jgi:hypothetical protein